MSTNIWVGEWLNIHRTVCERVKLQNQANVRKSLRRSISANNVPIVLNFGPQTASDLPFRLLCGQLQPVYPEIRIMKPTSFQNTTYLVESMFWWYTERVPGNTGVGGRQPGEELPHRQFETLLPTTPKINKPSCFWLRWKVMASLMFLSAKKF